MVPEAERVVFDEIGLAHFRIRDSDAGVVLLFDEAGVDDESGLRFRGADEVEHLVQIREGFSGPVPADFAKQAMLNRIPLGSPGRIVTDRDGKAGAIADLVLDSLLPGAATRAVASAPIGQDQNLVSLWVSLASLRKPPVCDGVGGESGRIVTGPHKNRASVGLLVVNAAGNRQIVGVRAKVVIVDRNGFAIPLGAGVLESAGQPPAGAKPLASRELSSRRQRVARDYASLQMG